jgi:hypothetical protein
VIRRSYSLEFRWCQPIGSAFHEANDPYAVIDPYRSVLPLEVQASLGCADKSLRICIGHKPMPALFLPSCLGADFATKFDQHGVPLESYATHLTSPVRLAQPLMFRSYWRHHKVLLVWARCHLSALKHDPPPRTMHRMMPRRRCNGRVPRDVDAMERRASYAASCLERPRPGSVPLVRSVIQSVMSALLFLVVVPAVRGPRQWSPSRCGLAIAIGAVLAHRRLGATNAVLVNRQA